MKRAEIISAKGLDGIKTIDELLAAVAENMNVGPSAPKKAPAPQKAQPHKTEELRPEAAAGREAEYSAAGTVKLDDAKLIAGAVRAAAEIIGVSVVTAVVNEGANLVCLEAMDNSYIASVNAARQKAYTAAALRMPTYKALEESRGGTLDGLTNGSGLLLLAGGEPLFDGKKLIGAVGVSGGTKEQDALLAKTAADVFKALRKII